MAVSSYLHIVLYTFFFSVCCTVERMFTSVDELEKVMHKLNQMSILGDNDSNEYFDCYYDAEGTDYTDCECTDDDDGTTDYIYADYSIDRHHNLNYNSHYSSNYNSNDDNDSSSNDATSAEDELIVISQKVTFFIKEMNENIERIERIIKKLISSR